MLSMKLNGVAWMMMLTASLSAGEVGPHYQTVTKKAQEPIAVVSQEQPIRKFAALTWDSEQPIKKFAALTWDPRQSGKEFAARVWDPLEADSRFDDQQVLNARWAIECYKQRGQWSSVPMFGREKK